MLYIFICLVMQYGCHFYTCVTSFSAIIANKAISFLFVGEWVEGGACAKFVLLKTRLLFDCLHVLLKCFL